MGNGGIGNSMAKVDGLVLLMIGWNYIWDIGDII